jgi:hypothetical protein
MEMCLGREEAGDELFVRGLRKQRHDEVHRALVQCAARRSIDVALDPPIGRIWRVLADAGDLEGSGIHPGTVPVPIREERWTHATRQLHDLRVRAAELRDVVVRPDGNDAPITNRYRLGPAARAVDGVDRPVHEQKIREGVGVDRSSLRDGRFFPGRQSLVVRQPLSVRTSSASIRWWALRSSNPRPLPCKR